jgi:hypothetical protein
MASARLTNVLAAKKVLTVADAIELLKEMNPDAILIRNDEGSYFGCTSVYDHVISQTDENLGWRVKKGQKAVTFV